MKRFLWIALSVIVFVVVTFFVLKSYTKSHSPAAVAENKSDGLEIKVDYCQPKMKGRKIFGGKVVPFNKVWRTGANEATEIELKQDVLVAGKSLKAGRYAFLTIPKEKEWTIIFNSVLGMWGHFTYSEAKDVLRVEVPSQTTDKSLEDFLITFADSGTGVDMKLAWEKTEVKVPFSKAK